MARGDRALKNQREFLGTFTGLFRIFVSPRIFQKNTVNSYSKARRGRCCFDCPRLQSAPRTSCPLLKLSFGRAATSPWGCGKGWGGGGVEGDGGSVHHVEVLGV